MHSDQFVLSLVQANVVLGDPEANLAHARDLVEEAARRHSDLIVLPELWTTGYDLENAATWATPLTAGSFAQVAAWARRYRVWITGSILEHTSLGVTNTAPLFSPQGEIVGVYRKVHLFPPMKEDRYLVPGEKISLFTLPWGRAGLAICYDLRFPELFRAYAAAGAVLLIIPAEWPSSRLHHWRTLNQARAIENQCFVAACNRVGEDHAYHFGGHSMLVSPDGEILLEGGAQEVLLTTEVPMTLIRQSRSSFFILQDRRPDLYSRSASADD